MASSSRASASAACACAAGFVLVCKLDCFSYCDIVGLQGDGVLWNKLLKNPCFVVVRGVMLLFFSCLFDNEIGFECVLI